MKFQPVTFDVPAIVGAALKTSYDATGWTALAGGGATSKVIPCSGARGVRVLCHMVTDPASAITSFTWRLLGFSSFLSNPVANQPGTEFLGRDGDDLAGALKWDHTWATGGASKTVEKSFYTLQHEMIGFENLVLQVKTVGGAGQGIDSASARIIVS